MSSWTGGDRSEARVAAHAAGRLFYVGTACKLGHTMRYVVSGTCVQCGRASTKRWWERVRGLPRGERVVKRRLNAVPLEQAMRAIAGRAV